MNAPSSRAHGAARISTLSSRLKLRACAHVGEAPTVRGRVRVHGGGRIIIGARVVIDGVKAPVELYAEPSAELRLGDDVHLGPGVSLVATASVCIQDRVCFGEFAKVLDSHFHQVAGQRSTRPPSAAVAVGSDCEIGARAILLPGARLGPGTRVAAGAVVSRRGRPSVPTAAPAAEPTASGMAVTLRRLLRAPEVLHAWMVFGTAAAGKIVLAGWPIRVVHRGTLSLGDRARVMGGIVPSEIICHERAELHIGEHTCIGYGSHVEAALEVRIGARCLIGSMVRISDADEAGQRRIRIGDDVWIAHGATIAPGVDIGQGSVIGAGSVVSADVPAGYLALGNPARVLPMRMF